MSKLNDILKDVEDESRRLKVKTALGEFSLVGHSITRRMFILEDKDGKISMASRKEILSVKLKVSSYFKHYWNPLDGVEKA